MADLVRSGDGSVIHAHTCRYARSGRTWRWAVGMSAGEIRRALAETPGLGVRECAVCRPLTVLAPAPSGDAA